MEGEEKGAFYLVRKGDVIGIYKSLSDFQAGPRASVADPSVTVYKGYGLSKDAEVYLASCGLKNAAYSISAADVKDNTFGELSLCSPQEATGSSTLVQSHAQKNHIKLESCVQGHLISSNSESVGSASVSVLPFSQKRNQKLESFQSQSISSSRKSCVLYFDGASKGNPGLAGAGAVLRSEDGKMVYRLREGLGIATNNVAEYRAAILGMKYALKAGFTHIRVLGDSKLVVMQIQGQWKIKSPNLFDLSKEARELKDKFMSYQISHVDRELNSEADSLANQAVILKDGEIGVDTVVM